VSSRRSRTGASPRDPAQGELALERVVADALADGPDDRALRDDPASRAYWTADDAGPGHVLAERFAAHAATWSRARGAPAAAVDTLRNAAYAASRVTTLGHVCVALDDLAAAQGPGASDLRARLLASGVVGTPAAPDGLPLILDEGDRLYLHRYFDYAQRLARHLLARAGAPVEPPPPGLHAALDRHFAANAERLGGRVDWQRLAVALAMMRRLAIISGGPGTGKTTSVVNLLACLLAQDPDCRIRLTAPTGKAAARMLDAIRARADALPADVAARFPAESFTLHRLLGSTGDAATFRYHAGNLLPVDVLVVDEASMLDLGLATHLFEAVPSSARVVLLGDKDQLASVEAGAVFGEICADPSLTRAMRDQLAAATGIPAERIVPPAATAPTPLRDCVVWLTENFRFGSGSGIGRLAALVNDGNAAAAIEWLRAGTDASVQWIEDGERTPGMQAMAAAEAGYRPYVEAIRAGAKPGAVFEAFNAFRVLCAERAGPRGVAALNASLSRWFRSALDHALDDGPRASWYPGRPVMVLRNDYMLRLYNGDVGIALPDDEGRLAVCFPAPDGSMRRVAPGRLPEHETAFATTVHKAQGSEFAQVLLLLPSRDSPVLTRELVYTAVTRASVRSVVAGAAEALQAVDHSPKQRHTMLMAGPT
jgi:exodeoxyribonuclease V alpha subunit